MSQATTQPRQLLIIDSQVNNWQSLANDVGTDTDVLILDSSSDGLTQISDYLTALSANASTQDFTPLQSIHIMSHGSAGSLLLGSSTVTSSNLSLYGKQLASLGNALTENGDILLYGCNVAQGEAGLAFINQLAELTGADVAASDDLTGAADQLANWLLEANTGTIEAATLNVGSDYDFILSVDTGKVVIQLGNYEDDRATDVTIQSDDKIVVAGAANVRDWDFSLIRLTKDGTLDKSFSDDGKVIIQAGDGFDFASSITQQANGKIVVAGWGRYSNEHLDDASLIRLNKDGSLDNSFGTNGGVIVPLGDYRNKAYSVTVQSDDKIVVAGQGDNDSFLVRLNDNGSLDKSFGKDGKVITPPTFAGRYTNHFQVTSIVIQTDGKIVVAGTSNRDTCLMRFNPNGSIDASFDGDGIAIVQKGIYGNTRSADSVILQPDGKIVVAGTDYNENRLSNGYGHKGFSLTRFNIDGSLDSSFNKSGTALVQLGSYDDYAYSVTLQANGKIVVAGISNTEDGGSFGLIRLNADGSLDTSFSDDGKALIQVGSAYDTGAIVALQSDGKIVVVGNSSNNEEVAGGWIYPGDTHFSIIRLNEDGRLDTSFGGTSTSTTDTVAPTLSSISPTDNATDVIVSADLVLTFSEAIKAGTGNFIIYNTNGTVAKTIAVTDTSQVTVSGNTVTINPNTDLAAGSSYYLNTAAGVLKDLAGNSFAGIASTTAYNFSTVADKISGTTDYPSNPNYNLAVAADLAGLSVASYLTGDALKTKVDSLGWIFVAELTPPPSRLIDAQAVIVERTLDGHKEMAIAFRGTAGGTDIATDFSLYGFSEYYKALRPWIEQAVMQAVQKRYDNIYITGHSLGGAAAQIAMIDMLEPTALSVWTGIGTTVQYSPLQVGDRFLDSNPGAFTADDWSWLRSHLHGVTIGAPSISIDAPSHIPAVEENFLNSAFSLDKYKDLLFQFELKSNSSQLPNPSGSLYSDEILIDDPIASLASANTDRGDELGSLVAIELSDGVGIRYWDLAGGAKASLHSKAAYYESLLRLLTNATLLDPGNNSAYLPSLTTYTGVGDSTNDLVLPDNAGDAYGFEGNDILVASAGGNYQFGGGSGDDVYTISAYGVNVTISGPAGEHLDRLYFNLEGQVSAFADGENLVVAIDSPSGVSTATIVGWFAQNSYQLSEIAKIPPIAKYWDKETFDMGNLIDDDYAGYAATSGYLTVNGSITGSIEVGADSVWFRVDLTAGKSYQFDLTGVTGGGGTLADPKMKLLDASGAELAHNDDINLFTNQDSHIAYTAVATGTYYIEAAGVQSKTGSYTLAASLSVTDPIKTLTGTPGKDTLSGSSTAELIDGLAGNDALYGNEGNDSLNGGAGYDYLVGGKGDDTLNGGADIDAVDYYYYDTTGSVTVNLALGTATGAGIGTDTLVSIETVYGSYYNDTLTGDANTNYFCGIDGNDKLDGAGGNDMLWGGAGNDTLLGGTGADTFYFAANQGKDTINDFNKAEGDKIAIYSGTNGITTATQAVTHLTTNAAGAAVLDLGAGNSVMLVGVSAALLNASLFAIV